MFTIMYVGHYQSRRERLKNPTRLKVIELVADFVPRQSFGIIGYEVRKYLGEEMSSVSFAHRSRPGISLYQHCNERYAPIPDWCFYANRLLQTGGTPSSFLREKGRCSKRNILSSHLSNETRVLASTREAALSRIFFEIGEFLPRMVAGKDVSRGCGYSILKRMQKEEGALGQPTTFSVQEILEWFDYSNLDLKAIQHVHRESKLNPLKEGGAGLLVEDGGRYGLSPLSREALVLADANADEIAQFPYRTQFFYPYEKSARALAERKDRTVIKLS